MTLNVKKGDTVLVIAGKDNGKTGKVLSVLPSDEAVVVSGINIIAKHKKPRKANEKGGIMKGEGKIHVSNVQVVCPTCNKATRIAHALIDDKNMRKCKKCGAIIETAKVKKEAAKSAKTETKKSTAPKAAVTKKDSKTETVSVKKTVKSAINDTTKVKTSKPAATKKAVNTSSKISSKG